MPSQHAAITASGSYRWLNCPPSARWAEEFPDTASAAAEEGTKAHALAEKKLNAWIRSGRRQRFKEDDEVMQEATDNYRDYVIGIYNDLKAAGSDPDLNVEVRLDLSDWVPEGFGTSDACIPSTKTLHIIDLKYGKGVKVGAENNSQMRLYALGAAALFGPLYEFDKVAMHIYQPRLDNISVEEISLKELLEWGESIKPIAKLAFDGKGEARSGDWCTFCPCRHVCKTRASEMFSVLEEQPDTTFMTLEDVAAYLPKLDEAIKWAKGLQDYALEKAKAGEKVPGYKLVEGRAVRKIKDDEALAAALGSAGYTADQIWKPKELQTLTALERLVGKKAFASDYADFLEKPSGKPVLVPENDKRPELQTLTAENMFKEIKEGENHAA